MLNHITITLAGRQAMICRLNNAMRLSVPSTPPSTCSLCRRLIASEYSRTSLCRILLCRIPCCLVTIRRQRPVSTKSRLLSRILAVFRIVWEIKNREQLLPLSVPVGLLSERLFSTRWRYWNRRRDG